MCYKTDCKEECDEFKKMYCVMKVTKEQRDFMRQALDESYCEVCGKKKVKAKYRGVEIDLCTDCGVLKQVI